MSFYTPKPRDEVAGEEVAHNEQVLRSLTATRGKSLAVRGTLHATRVEVRSYREWFIDSHARLEVWRADVGSVGCRAKGGVVRETES